MATTAVMAVMTVMVITTKEASFYPLCPRATLSADGCHFKDAGYKQIAETVKSALDLTEFHLS